MALPAGKDKDFPAPRCAARHGASHPSHVAVLSIEQRGVAAGARRRRAFGFATTFYPAGFDYIVLVAGLVR